MRALLLASLCALLPPIAAGAGAQQPLRNPPHAGYVYPAGAQRGTTVVVEVGGQFLNGAAGAMVSGGGVRARVLGYDRPLPPMELQALRDTAQALQQQLRAGGGRDPAVVTRLGSIVARISQSVLRAATPVLAERVAVEVSVAPDAPPGRRRLRLATPAGLTLPLVFEIDTLPEYREPRDSAQVRALLARASTARAASLAPARRATALVPGGLQDGGMSIALPAMINGRLIPGEGDATRPPSGNSQQYRPGDVDRYRFRARRGQHLVAVAHARGLLPYLADGVPGWCQAVLTLYDGQGREIAYADDFRFDPDPVLHFQVPADGEYVLEIRDALYRGREDFVYRLAVGELPFVTDIFPLGGRRGTSVPVSLSGWNLPASRDTVRADLALVQVGSRPFATDTLAEVLEEEPASAGDHAQSVAVPVVVNGRIDTPGDRDVFRFRAEAGVSLVVAVWARRLGSPLDAALELVDENGTRVSWNDDTVDPTAALLTHHADPQLQVTIPRAGTYELRLHDVQQHGGAEYAYRLRIAPRQPDFELRVTPSAIAASPGMTVPVTVTAIRRDGFAGDILLSIADAARPLVPSGGLIPAGADHITMTITVPPARLRTAASPALQAIAIEGRADIAGRAVVRRAVPADELTQAFAYRHLVPAEALWLTTGRQTAGGAPARMLTPQPVLLVPGGSVSIEAALPPSYRQLAPLQFQLRDPPPGVTVGVVRVDEDRVTIELRSAGAGLAAGARGNLLIEVSGEVRPPTSQGPPRPARRIALGVLPAITYQAGGRDRDLKGPSGPSTEQILMVSARRR